MAYEDVVTTAVQSAARAIAQSVVRRETPCTQTDQATIISRLDPVADATLIAAFKKECARQKANEPGKTPVGVWVVLAGAAAWLAYYVYKRA